MFNDIENNKNNNSIKDFSEKAASNLSKKETQSSPQDIFANIETTTNINPSDKPKPDIFKPVKKNSKSLNDKNSDFYQKQASQNKKIFLLLFIVVGFLIIVLIGFWILKYFVVKPEKIELNNIIDNELDFKKNEKKKGTNYFIEDNKEEIEDIDLKNIDSDHDGLSDDEEEKYGTDKNNPDTDNDKLFDREEIYVYKTDPLNPDSDGDSYHDGDEVLKGYNPLGSGKLRIIE